QVSVVIVFSKAGTISATVHTNLLRGSKPSAFERADFSAGGGTSIMAPQIRWTVLLVGNAVGRRAAARFSR
ncbi:MAG: hypothetical protein WBZ19_14580, partial [Chthoniobacterales bacterium]